MASMLPPLPDLNSLIENRRKVIKTPPMALEPEERQGLISKIASGSLSGLSYLGGVLGKAVRPVTAGLDLLAGGNPDKSELLSFLPFSDFSGYTKQENAVSGRDLLEDVGVIGPNNHGKLDFGDIAGFLAETALDPLSYATLGGSALAKAGRIAKAAGFMDEAGKLTVRSAIAPGGKNMDRISNTLRGVMGTRPESLAAARKAAEGMGLNLDDHLDDNLGGMLGLGSPWIPWLSKGDARYTLGRGRTAQALAGAQDFVGENLLYGDIPFTGFSPGRVWSTKFDNDVGGMHTADAQRRFRQAAQEEDLHRADIRGYSSKIDDYRRRTGTMNDGGSTFIRGMLEQGKPAPGSLVPPGYVPPAVPAHVPQQFVPMYQDIRSTLDDAVVQAQQSGANLKEMQEEYYSNYFPRHSAQSAGAPSRSRPGSAFSPNQISRDNTLKNFPGHSEEINQMAREVAPLIDGGASHATLKSYLEARHPWLTQFTPGNELGTKSDELSKFFRDRPVEELNKGIFVNDVGYDLENALLNISRSDLHARAAADLLARPQALADAAAPLIPGRVRLRDIAENINLNLGDANGGLISNVAQRLGVPMTRANIRLLKEMQIPEGLAADLGRVNQPLIESPISPLMSAVDSFTNLFKAGNTVPWPAFSMRNLASGALRNVEEGNATGRSYKAAKDILQGGTSESVQDIPLIREILNNRGLPITPENASNVARQLAYQYEIVGKNQGYLNQVTGAGAAAEGKSAADRIASYPGGMEGGYKTFDAKRIGKKYAFMHPDVTVNPLDVKGFRGKDVTNFGPAAGGEDFNQFAEGINRLSPFLEELRRGVDPAVAKQRVLGSQVDYSGRKYTNFERDYMSRLMPFYKYTKGNTPYVARKLLERPGGPTSQTYKAFARAHAGSEAMLPEQVSSSAAIPFGTDSAGDPRYITSLGLMSEDASQFFGDGLKGAGLEALSRLNPIIKGPLEGITGQSFFQRGPDGGRPLSEMDPVVGRLLRNLTSRDPESEPVHLPGIVEGALSNSPISRLLTTARKLTDPRKAVEPGSVIPGLAALIPMVTGLQVTDVSPKQQDALLFDALQNLLKENPSAKSFTDVYIPDEALKEMGPDELKVTLQHEALVRELQNRAKARAAEKKGIVPKEKKRKVDKYGLPVLPSMGK